MTWSPRETMTVILHSLNYCLCSLLLHKGRSYYTHHEPLLLAALVKYILPYYTLTTREKQQKKGIFCLSHLIPQKSQRCLSKNCPHSPSAPHLNENPANTVKEAVSRASEGQNRTSCVHDSDSVTPKVSCF